MREQLFASNCRTAGLSSEPGVRIPTLGTYSIVDPSQMRKRLVCLRLAESSLHLRGNSLGEFKGVFCHRDRIDAERCMESSILDHEHIHNGKAYANRQ